MHQFHILQCNAPFRTALCIFLLLMEHCGTRKRCILWFVNWVNFTPIHQVTSLAIWQSDCPVALMQPAKCGGIYHVNHQITNNDYHLQDRSAQKFAIKTSIELLKATRNGFYTGLYLANLGQRPEIISLNWKSSHIALEEESQKGWL